MLNVRSENREKQKPTICVAKCRGSLNVNADVTYSNNYALEVHIIIGNCVKIYATIQQVEQVARELPDAGPYSRWNTKAL